MNNEKWYECVSVDEIGEIITTVRYTVECRRCHEQYETFSLYEAMAKHPTCPNCGYTGEVAR